jgi:hypothetical protein
MNGMNLNPRRPGPVLDTRAADRAADWMAVRMTFVMAFLLVGTVVAWTLAFPAAATSEDVQPASLPFY